MTDRTGEFTRDPTAYLPILRAEFPRWACLYALDRHGDWAWVALRGRAQIWAHSGIELREQLQAATRRGQTS
jgi:hypothetical protein